MWSGKTKSEIMGKVGNGIINIAVNQAHSECVIVIIIFMGDARKRGESSCFIPRFATHGP